MSLVRGIAGKVHKKVGQHVEYDDLLGLGTTGLLEAAERFDPAAGHSFSTFGYYRIRGAIYDGLRRMGHLPPSEYRKLKRQQKATEYLEAAAASDEAARSAPGGEVGARSAEDELRSMYEAMQSVATVFVTSLQEQADKGAEFADDSFDDPADRAAMKELRGDLVDAIAALPDRERHFVEKHYLEGKTLQEAGKELGLSKSWASRLHARAIDMLKKKLRDHAPT